MSGGAGKSLNASSVPDVGCLESPAEREPAEVMLTVDAAAELMACSRPYVAMLIDSKKLGLAAESDGGRRKVSESAVRAWIKEHEATSREPDYHAVAEANGMYEIPETAFIQANKRRS